MELLMKRTSTSLHRNLLVFVYNEGPGYERWIEAEGK